MTIRRTKAGTLAVVDTSCPESVRGHDNNGRTDGRCTWCLRPFGRRATPPVDLGRSYRTDADLAYRRFYDPDWGSDRYDVDV